MPPHLPIELIEHIIDQLCDSRPSLKACALVCRAWLPQSRTHLFHSIRLYPRKVKVFVKLYTRTLQTFSHARLRKLELTNHLGTDASEVRKFEGLCDLSFFSDVEELKLSYIDWHFIAETTKRIIYRSFPAVKSLGIDTLRFHNPADLPKLVDSFPSLQTLCFNRTSRPVDFDHWLQWMLAVPTAVQTSATQLTTLTLSAITHPQVIECLGPCPRLRSLNFSNTYIYTRLGRAISRIAESAGDSLEEVRLVFHASALSDFVPEMMDDILLGFGDRLRSISFARNTSLKRLDLSVYENPSQLVPFLEQFKTCSRLENLRLPRLHCDLHPDIHSGYFPHDYDQNAFDILDDLLFHLYQYRHLRGIFYSVVKTCGHAAHIVRSGPVELQSHLEAADVLMNHVARMTKSRMPKCKKGGILYCEEDASWLDAVRQPVDQPVRLSKRQRYLRPVRQVLNRLRRRP